MVVHGLAAVLSSLSGHFTLYIFRFLLLVVAFSLFIHLRRAGPGAVSAARFGMTTAGLFLVLFHIPLVPGGRLADPSYRISDYLNPNSTALVSAFTGISILDYALVRLRDRKWLSGMLLLLATAACMVILVATKSAHRGGRVPRRLAGAVGHAPAPDFRAGAVPARRARGTRDLRLAGRVRARRLGRVHARLDPAERLDHDRPARQLAVRGRDALLPQPLPGGRARSSFQQIGVVHNAWLFNLCEVGLLGTLPLVALVVGCGIQVIRNWKDRRIHFAAALLFAGLLESVSEESLFSIGNSGSLLFLFGGCGARATAEGREGRATAAGRPPAATGGPVRVRRRLLPGAPGSMGGRLRVLIRRTEDGSAAR